MPPPGDGRDARKIEPVKGEDSMPQPDVTGPSQNIKLSEQTPKPKNVERNFPLDPDERAPGVERDRSLYVPIQDSSILIHHDVDIKSRGYMDQIIKDDRMVDTYFGSHGSVFGIEPDQFKLFLNETPGRYDYAIIDLRWPEGDYENQSSDQWRQFEGAVHFQATTSLNAPDYVIKYRNLNNPGDEGTSRDLWHNVMNDNTQAISGVTGKNYLFFHCVDSINRTPVAASGFVKFVLPTLTHQPTVVILEGGFSRYSSTCGTVETKIEPWQN